MKPGSAATAGIEIGDGQGDGERRLGGALTIHTVGEARRALRGGKIRALDLAGLETLDTPGALLLCALQKKGVALKSVRAEHKALLDLICSLTLKHMPLPKELPAWRGFVVRVGQGAIEAWQATREIITFTGRAAVALVHAVSHPRRLRFIDIAHHIEDTGIDALPIVALMAGMIAVVIAYQGVAQLRPYGGEEFTINLVAVSVLREMGVLITAIMVAGRSGSAFAAEIGTMKSREEIDALNVMGFDTLELLVVPRLLALMITLPLLVFFADMMGLLGGGIISKVLLGVEPWQYIARVHQAVKGNDFYVGLYKAPVFAFFIGVIGCLHGLKVTGSAESVGEQTTSAVVKTVFLVITLDALFSILFEKLGI